MIHTIGQYLADQHATKTFTLVTANQRLSNYLHQLYNQHQYQKGLTAWPTLDLLPLTTWLKRCFDWLDVTPHLLTPTQTLWLWQSIIKRDNENQPLLDIPATAQLAKQAWDYINLWHIPLTHLTDVTNVDHQAFYRWACEFRKLCSEQNFIDEACLMSYLQKRLIEKAWSPPEAFVLAGFDSMPPATHALLQQIAQQNCHVSTLLLDAEPANTQYKLQFSNREKELWHMATWAKNRLKTNPNAKIGCVVTHLEQHREQCTRIFTEVLTSPETRNHYSPDIGRNFFNISLGQPLHACPLIYTALLILKLNPYTISLNELSYLLRSPFIEGGEKEGHARMCLDTKVRDDTRRTLSLKQLLRINNKAIAENQPFACPLWQKALKMYLSYRQKLTGNRYPSQWIETLQKCLELMGWPGERTLDSFEYQQYSKWQNVLQTLASLDTVSPPISYEQSLTQLTQITQRMIFQPQTPSAPIQILGPLEASGIHFDALWVSGMEETHWPPGAEPNPLLPFQLQRQYKLPHASSHQESFFCQQLFKHFTHCTNVLITSYINQLDDQPQLPSPLIETIPETEPSTLGIESVSMWPKLDSTIPLETIEDTSYVQMPPQIHNPGGVSLFKHQAACPFRAFAYFRLNARTIQHPTVGFELQERGSLLHQVLAYFWDQVTDQTQLNQLAEDELCQLIQQAVDQACSELTFDISFEQNLLELEKHRLWYLVYQWIQQEKQRPYFKVLAKETQRSLEIGDIQVQLKIDRIDQASDGTHWVIDYKTGQIDMKEWFGERPTEPQLPLYGLSSPQSISALVIGQVQANQCAYKGCSKSVTRIKGIQPFNKLRWTTCENWEQQIQQWQVTFEKLAKDFQKGYAAVAPKDPPKTCQYCDLQPLCRIHEKINV